MYVFLPKDKWFIQRVGKYECWTVNEGGHLEQLDVKPNLSDITFKENDNFYTHSRETVKYWTVGSDKLICVQEFQAKYRNDGFHAIHDRYASKH